jgi:hypothetical protein
VSAGYGAGSADPDALNAAAAAVRDPVNNPDVAYNVLLPGNVTTAPAYFPFDPAPFVRPYDLGSH